MKQKEIARYGRNSDGSNVGIMSETLVIYELKTCYKGVVYKSTQNGWMKKENIIMSAKFFEKDGDMTIHRVIEYFGFKNEHHLHGEFA